MRSDNGSKLSDTGLMLANDGDDCPLFDAIGRAGCSAALTHYCGDRVDTFRASAGEARAAEAERQAGGRPAGRERFEDYVERWLDEHTGPTANSLAPSTRAAYSWTTRG